MVPDVVTELLTLVDKAEKAQGSQYAMISTLMLRGLVTDALKRELLDETETTLAYRAVWPSGVVSTLCPVTTDRKLFFKAFDQLCQSFPDAESIPHVEIREARVGPWRKQGDAR